MNNAPPTGGISNCSDRSAWTTKQSSPSARSKMWLLFVLSLALTFMTACGSAAVQQGVFAIRLENRALTWVGEPAGIPIWSPIDNLVAWANEDGLFLRDLDDADLRQLSASPVAGVPAWSPGGKSLAYIDRDRASLVVVEVASGVEKVTQPLDRRRNARAQFPLLTLGGPAWSPDGSRIAYVCWDGAGDEICLIRSDGTGLRQLTRLERPTTHSGSATPQSLRAASNTGPPAWSPDGDFLAVAVYPERPGAPTGVFLVDLDEGLGRRVSSLQPNSVIIWSPEGGSIVFSAFRRGRSDTFRVVLATYTQFRVTEALPDASRNPAVAPDGSRIAVESGGGIVVVGRQGPPQAFSVSGLRSSFPSWSPDGTMIAIAATSDPIASYN
jgi:Tol biopolymer transport system component